MFKPKFVAFTTNQLHSLHWIFIWAPLVSNCIVIIADYVSTEQ